MFKTDWNQKSQSQFCTVDKTNNKRNDRNDTWYGEYSEMALSVDTHSHSEQLESLDTFI